MVLGHEAPDHATGRSATGARRRSPSTCSRTRGPAISTTRSASSTSSATTRSFLINVGDEKGEILDAAVRARRAASGARARHLLRLQRAAHGAGRCRPGARSSRSSSTPRTPTIARRIWSHAGVGDRVTVVVGTLGDGGKTIERSRSEHGFGDGTVDFVFIDHDKNAYLPDLERILEQAGCTRARWWWPTTSSSPARPSTGPTCSRRGQALAHRRARHARRVPVADQGPRARVGVPRRAKLTAAPLAIADPVTQERSVAYSATAANPDSSGWVADARSRRAAARRPPPFGGPGSASVDARRRAG